MARISDELRELANDIDGTGDGIEDWEAAPAHFWAMRIRNAAKEVDEAERELDAFAVGAVWRRFAEIKHENAACHRRINALLRSNNGLSEENEHLRDMLNDVAAELGLSDDECHFYSEDNYDECEDKVLDAIRSRLMPEGMEWPRYVDDELLVPGYEVCNGTVAQVIFADDGTTLVDEHGEVLDFLEAGDLLIHPVQNPAHHAESSPDIADASGHCPESAESRPESGTECPESDSWEKLGEDCQLHPSLYWREQGKYCVMGGNPDACDPARLYGPMIDDIVRRAKALAGGAE